MTYSVAVNNLSASILRSLCSSNISVFKKLFCAWYALQASWKIKICWKEVLKNLNQINFLSANVEYTPHDGDGDVPCSIKVAEERTWKFVTKWYFTLCI